MLKVLTSYQEMQAQARRGGEISLCLNECTLPPYPVLSSTDISLYIFDAAYRDRHGESLISQRLAETHYQGDT